MAILHCSQNDAVREKWAAGLSPQYETYQAASVHELDSLLESFKVEIILIHRSMVGEKQLKQIITKCGGSKVFVFADRPNDFEGAACLQWGCVGYTNTYIAPERLCAAVEAVQSGLVWIGTSLMQYLIKSLAVKDSQQTVGNNVQAVIDTLSKREYQVASLVAGGMQNKEIANELDITERTVKAHLSAVYTKTQTNGRLNLALLMR